MTYRVNQGKVPTSTDQIKIPNRYVVIGQTL